MTTRKETLTEIEYLLSLKVVMETYEEIAASRMQQIRSKVIQSRDFLFEINSIFQQVKSSYREEVEKLMKRKKIKDLARLKFLNHNGKTLFVLISANTGLYGDIIRRTFSMFTDAFKKVLRSEISLGEKKNDIAIIGRLGRNEFQEEFPEKPFTYFDLPDNKVEIEGLKTIIANFIRYEKILVFYGQFQNIVSQEPLVTSISGDMLPWIQEKSEIKYVFEPSLEKIMEFFEKEVFVSIFEQVIFESQLAKFASRMVALEKAVENTQDRLKQMILKKERIRHQAINKKQAERLASVWMKTTGKL